MGDIFEKSLPKGHEDIGEGSGTPLQCSCLENPMDGGAWSAAVHGVAKSRTWLSDFTFTSHFHALEKEKATHSSVLAWRIPGTGEPAGVPSMGLHRVRHDWSSLAAAIAAWRYSLMFYSRSFTVSHLGLWTMSNLYVLCKVHLDFWMASCLVLTPVSGYELAYFFV